MAPREVRSLTTPVFRELAGAVLNAPVAGGTSIIRCPTGRTYHSLTLQLRKVSNGIPTRAEVEAAIGSIRIMASGSEVWTATGLQLMAVSEYYSEIDTSTDGRLVINFQRGWMLSSNIIEILGASFGTADQSSFDVEIDWAAGSTITAAKAFAFMGQVAEPAGKILTLRRVTANITSTGIYQFTDLPQPKTGDFLAAIHCFLPVVGNLDRLAYVADDQRVMDIEPGLMNKYAQQAHPPRTPQTGKNVFSLDFCTRGMAGDMVDLGRVSSHMLEFTISAAAPNAVPVLCEILTDLPGSSVN